MEAAQTRTPEEIEADIKKTKAETIKVEAEAAKAAAECLQAETKAEKASLELLRFKEERKKRLASDEENFVYRFSGSVGKESVRGCREKLTEWSRLTPGCDIEIVFASGGGSIIYISTQLNSLSSVFIDIYNHRKMHTRRTYSRRTGRFCLRYTYTAMVHDYSS